MFSWCVVVDSKGEFMNLVKHLDKTHEKIKLMINNTEPVQTKIPSSNSLLQSSAKKSLNQKYWKEQHRLQVQ